MSKSVLTLTDRAVTEVKCLLAKRSAFGIRVGVKSGGCSKVKYCIEYADEKSKFDELIEVQEVKVLIDQKALMYVIGSEMDYVETIAKSGFTFNNPNEKARCGCGESFST